MADQAVTIYSPWSKLPMFSYIVGEHRTLGESIGNEVYWDGGLVKDLVFTDEVFNTPFKDFKFIRCRFVNCTFNHSFHSCTFHDCIFDGCGFHAFTFQQTQFFDTNFNDCSFQASLDVMECLLSDTNFRRCLGRFIGVDCCKIYLSEWDFILEKERGIIIDDSQVEMVTLKGLEWGDVYFEKSSINNLLMDFISYDKVTFNCCRIDDTSKMVVDDKKNVNIGSINTTGVIEITERPKRT